MLKLYPDQTAAFSRASVRDYESRMAAHLRRFFPQESRAMGPEGVAEHIRHAITRAAAHGLVEEHDVALYLNLTVALGRDFDRDPGLPWVQAALQDPALPDPSWRMGRLYRITVERTQVPVPGDDAYVD